MQNYRIYRGYFEIDDFALLFFGRLDLPDNKSGFDIACL